MCVTYAVIPAKAGMTEKDALFTSGANNMLKHKHVIILLLLTSFLTLFFWTQSRYPALNEKAAMTSETSISGLAFNPVIRISPQDSTWQHIIYSSLNWAETNRQGMTFGILFAALLLTMLPFFGGLNRQGRFGSTVTGTMIGAPLGVCVNCATPIAKGILAGGGRLETMLATLTASPTMNIIVLTMLFTLLPFYMAVLKVAFSMLFILLLIPLLTRAFPLTESCPAPAAGKPKRLHLMPATVLPSPNAGWWDAARWVSRHSLKNLWFIIRTTLPLMLLAGVLGAIAVTLIPFDGLAALVPQHGGLILLFGLIAVALFGIFLPTPIAFDVIVTMALLQTGLPVSYAMTLLFTMGIFSIYPFFVIWRDVSKQLAVSIVLILTAMGVAAGLAAQLAQQRDIRLMQETITQAFSDPSLPPVAEQFFGHQQPVAEGKLVASLRQHADVAEQMPIPTSETSASVTVSRIPFQPQRATGTMLFSKHDANAFGISPPYDYSALKSMDSFTELRGIAAGDVHQDGWGDLLLSSESGLYLYANKHGHGFALQQVEVEGLDGLKIFNAALVDLNNDGYPDIWFSAYRAGNFVIFNKAGHFSGQPLQRLPNLASAFITASAGFGDIDRDGDLDIMLGNSFFSRTFAPAQARNVMLENRGGNFAAHVILGVNGNSLSMLLSDFNGDNKLDMIVGNDFDAPDLYYMGRGNGDFDVPGDHSPLPVTTLNTMSITTADLDNDLRPEIFLAQTGRSDEAAFSLDDVEDEQACQDFQRSGDITACKRVHAVQRELIQVRESRSVKQCRSLEHAEFQRDCVARMLLLMMGSQQTGWKPSCEMLPAGLQNYAFICQQMKAGSPVPLLEQHIPQLNADNVLLVPNGNGGFANKAAAMGLSNTGWTWNAQFADLDNDEWQDIYIANGYFWSRKERTPDLFYRNMGGDHFEEQSKRSGLHGSPNTSSYVYLDFDHDGDLDVFTVSQDGAVVTYVNNTTTGHAIEFELRDHIGNSLGIGSKIIIYYGDGHHQMRELKASGGFASFNAPIAHFGLGQFKQIDKVEVIWSTGETSTLRGDNVLSGYRYTVNRTEP